jgi:ATP-dependent Clp protease ATP-binding subunit ClpC
MKKDIIPKVKAIMKLAFKEAKAYEDIKLRPEHIAISIVMDDDNKAVSTLDELGVDLSELYDLLSDTLKDVDVSARMGNPRTKVPPSDLTAMIFTDVDNQCDNLGDSAINTSHLLLAILNHNTPTTQILEKMGVDYNNFKTKLIEVDMDDNSENRQEEDLNKIKKMKKNLDEYKNALDDFDDSATSSGRDESSGRKKTEKSKTPVLDNFCTDISKAAEKQTIDPVVGRGNEIQRVSTILSRRKKNNPVLIGEPGVGKTSIVEGLAQLIIEKKAPRVLLDKKIYSLDLASMVAGTKYRGQFEERMKAVLEELKNNPNIILFIDELQTIVGAGNASGSLDASNIFKPALARGEIQVIGATTLDEYRENIETDGALTRRFQEVIVDEPTLSETKIILENIKEKYEEYHKVQYTDDAIDECVKMADRYISERAMPDKAIDILDEAGAITNVDVEVPSEIQKLEERWAEIKKEKLSVVQKQQYEKAAKLRDDERKVQEKLDKAKEIWMNSLDKERTIVDVDLVSEVVSNMTGIPLSKVSGQETVKLAKMENTLKGQVIGQDEAVVKVSKSIKRNRLGIRRRTKPIGSFIFLGPTGVGKTHLAKLLAEYVFGDKDALVRVDMSEYMEKFSVSRLVGAPPGYVGYEEGGKLTEAIRRKPYSVVLFDEIEKAHEDVFNLMLQLLDEGQLTDSLGRKVDFKNTLVILTSNVGVTELNSFGKSVGFETGDTVAKEEERARTIIEKALKKKFKPEFLNRIDDTIIFNSLKEVDIQEIIKLELESVKENLLELGYTLELDKKAMDYIAEQGYEPEYGARPLNRAIQRYVEDPISEEVINGNIKEGDTIKVSYDAKNDKMVVKTKKVRKSSNKSKD